MSEQVKRYDLSGFGGGMLESEDGAWYHMGDYDALHAEAEALRAENAAALRVTQSLVASVDRAEAELEALRSQLEVARGLLREWLDADFGASSPAINRMRCRTDYLLTATPESQCEPDTGRT